MPQIYFFRQNRSTFFIKYILTFKTYITIIFNSKMEVRKYEKENK